MAAEDNGLPVRELCNLDDPEEMFLWALLGLDDVNGAQVMVSFQHLRTISARIEAIGAMLKCSHCGYEKPPQIKYRPPMTAPMTPFDQDLGSWVPADEPDPERDPLGETLAQIKPHVLKAVGDRIREDHPEWYDNP